MSNLLNNQHGYLGVLTVMIISVITLGVAVSAALIGSNELLLGFGTNESHKALLLADGCAEEAYFRLKKNAAYTGGIIPTASVDCTVAVSGGGTTRLITSEVTIGNLTRSVTVNVDLVANTAQNADGIDLTLWNE